MTHGKMSKVLVLLAGNRRRPGSCCCCYATLFDVRLARLVLPWQYAEDVPETIVQLKPCLESDTCGRFDAQNPSGQGTAYVYYWRSMLRKPNKRTLEHIQCFKSHRYVQYISRI